MIGNKLILIITSLFVLVILFGCTQSESTLNKNNSFQTGQDIKCPTLDYSNCPQQKCPQLDCTSCQVQSCGNQIQTIVKYQCFDGTIVDTNSDCSKIISPTQSTLLKNFNGNNGTVTAQFYLKPGLAIFYAKYTGKNNFIVSLLDKDGIVGGLMSSIGQYDGSASATIKSEGYYRIEVDLGSYRDGTWEISVEQ
jgi:hypothetical protein